MIHQKFYQEFKLQLIIYQIFGLFLIQNMIYAQAIQFIKQILNGFKGIHQIGAIHRDLKPSNIQLHQGICKIADLGFAKITSDKYRAHSIIGTPASMAPQILQGKIYSKQVDIWSLGVLFYQMLFGSFPYSATSATKTKQLIEKIQSTKPSFEGAKISDQTRNLIERCLTVDPNQRILWPQIYQRPIFKSQDRKISCQTQSKIFIQLTSRRKNEQNQLTHLLGDLEDKKFDKYVNIYIQKRKSIIFSSIYVIPLMRLLFIIKGIHFQVLTMLLKATYLQLSSFAYHLKKQTNMFEIKHQWNAFLSSQQYAKICEAIKQDKHKIKISWQYYKSEFKQCREDVKAQTQLSFTQNSTFKQMVTTLTIQYCQILMKQFRAYTGNDKKTFIHLISSIKYLATVQYPVASQFENLIETIDYNQVEGAIKKY